MITQRTYNQYLTILQTELVKALGCTEPIAIAYGAAVARKYLKGNPDKVEIYCSGNIIKNVKGVFVPNSGGLKGIEAAVALGIAGGRAEDKLEVLEAITPADITKAKVLLEEDFCRLYVHKGKELLYIKIIVKNSEHSAQVEIQGAHTHITSIRQDELEIQSSTFLDEEAKEELKALNVEDILQFAQEAKIEDVKEILGNQLELNRKIAKDGLENHYGMEVGQGILKNKKTPSVKEKAIALAAAGSDARMGGSSFPVVINSGSGNQGMTVSLPVFVYGEHLKVSEEKLYRSLIISNLIAIHQKRFIGKLSAFCSVISASAATGAAITYLYDGSKKQIEDTITNTLGTLGGVVCDGAKPSCASKIASAVETAIRAHEMAMDHKAFLPGDGVVGNDIEETIKNFGLIGREGMKETDEKILGIMTD